MITDTCSCDAAVRPCQQLQHTQRCDRRAWCICHTDPTCPGGAAFRTEGAARRGLLSTGAVPFLAQLLEDVRTVVAGKLGTAENSGFQATVVLPEQTVGTP